MQSNSKTQRQEIFDLLKSRAGEWVPSFELSRIALQYNARVFELRETGAVISNRREFHDGQVLSWYRLEDARPTPKPQAERTPSLFPRIPERHVDNG